MQTFLNAFVQYNLLYISPDIGAILNRQQLHRQFGVGD
jgi:hypothetical protein